MATFQQAYTRLMRTVNRPLTDTDVLQGAKDAINDALMFLQRNHAYRYAQDVANIAYAANTFAVDVAASNSVRDIISVQELSASGTVQGKPLKVISYTQLQAMRAKYERAHTTVEPYTASETVSSWTIEDAFRTDRIAFMLGKQLGIYPQPTEALTLRVAFNTWYEALSGDSDTHFLLDYAEDVVQLIALKKMSFYIKTDSRFQVQDAEVQQLLAGLITWDSQLHENSDTSLT